MYWIYVLKSVNYEKTYVGLTKDLQRRFTEHNNGKSKYTNKFKPWIIVYTEQAENLQLARIKEKYYKSAAGRKKIKLILNNLRPRSSAG